MQSFLFACYLCLQLTNLSNDLTQSASLKKDTACNRCLTGLFDHSELLSRIGAEPEQPMNPNQALIEALEERLMLELSRSATKTRALQIEEPKQNSAMEDKIKRAQEILAGTESALRDMQENMMDKMMRKSEEVMAQLHQHHTQLTRELSMQAAKQKESFIQEKENENENEREVEATQVKKNVNMRRELEIAKPNKNVLNPNVKLMPGEQLVSENGRFRALLLWSGHLVIIDQQKNSVVKKIGSTSEKQLVRHEYLMLKPEGTLVIKSSHRSVADWTTDWTTEAYPDSALYSHILKLENYGQLVVYDALNRRIWTSGFV